MELLIPALHKIISYPLLVILLKGANHERSSQNSFSLHGALKKVWEEFFSKEAFYGGKTFFGKNIYGEIILNGRTNDQIMLKWGRSFILKNAFSSNLNNVNLVYFED